MIIYIVEGTTGEYDDRIDWPVCSYTEKQLANIHAEKAQLAVGGR